MTHDRRTQCSHVNPRGTQCRKTAGEGGACSRHTAGYVAKPRASKSAPLSTTAFPPSGALSSATEAPTSACGDCGACPLCDVVLAYEDACLAARREPAAEVLDAPADVLLLAGIDMTPRRAATAMPPVSHRPKLLSQWFTSDDLAVRLVEWCGRPRMGSTVLEPSAGAGALVEAICDVFPMPVVTAIEIDETFAEPLRRKHSGQAFGDVRVECCDYLRRSAPAKRYDICVMNPPYEGGLDGAFIAKAMDESQRIVGLCRLNVFVSGGRYERVWSRIPSEWSLTGIAFLVSRPSFLLAGAETDSPMSDFVAFKMERGGACAETRVEWWT